MGGHCFALTLRGLSLFCKILPISKTGACITYILATVHFLYPKLGSFSDMEYYFYQLAYRDSKVSKHFVGLNQIKSSPSLTGVGAKKMTPLHLSTSYTHNFRFYSKGNASVPTRVCGWGHWNPQFVWVVRGHASIQPPLTRGNHSPTSRYLGKKTAEKLSTF